MRIIHIIKIALRGVNANKMRSALTVLGIVIGVAAVISLMSIGRGTQKQITDSIGSMGTNLLFVTPGATTEEGTRGAVGSANTLTMDDAQAISELPTVAAVAPEIKVPALLVFGGQNTMAQALGVTPEYEYVRNLPVAEGEFISVTNVKKGEKVIVLGSEVAKILFGLRSPIGQSVKVVGVAYEVIGVLESKGGSGTSSPDNMVLLPITTVQARVAAFRTISGAYTVNTISVQIIDSNETDLAIQQIVFTLEETHQIAVGAADDFTVSSQRDMIATLLESSNIIVIFLGAVAGISLLVGGIGIMNIMLVSVTERTREIGIRKSVGARRRDILLQFLVESASLSLLGGGIGIVCGWGISNLIGEVEISGTNIVAIMSADIYILAVSVSVLIGIVFGLYPAYRAARLNPIDALRYE